MKVFWAITLLVLVAAGVYLFAFRGTAPAAPKGNIVAIETPAEPEQAASATSRDATPSQTPSSREPAPVATSQPRLEEPTPSEPEPSTSPSPATTPTPTPSPTPEPARTQTPEKKPVEPLPVPDAAMDLAKSLDALLGTADPASVDFPTYTASTGPAATKSPASSGDAPAAPSATASAKTAKVVTKDDGSLLLDDRFVIKGAGTKDDPYRITWDLLTSCEETYRPRAGLKTVPGRLTMLDGKWVRIGGFIAFPIMAQSPEEMLMMLNQWDGCCIGVPPTPYDAIEVKLKVAAKGDDRLRTSGTVTGLLRVDPYLIKDWLVSLYVMDNAELSEIAGTAPTPPPGSGPHQGR